MLQAVRSSAWKVVAASMVAGQVLSPVLMGVQGRPPFEPGQLPVLALTGLVVGAWLLFTAWTWRRLARMGTDDRRHVFNRGVLAWGIPVGMTMSVSGAARDTGGLDRALSWEFAAALLIQLLINVPLFLWGGWFFGWVMTAALGPPRRSSSFSRQDGSPRADARA